MSQDGALGYAIQEGHMGLTGMALTSRERPDIARCGESGGLVQIWRMVNEPPQMYKDGVKPNHHHFSQNYVAQCSSNRRRSEDFNTPENYRLTRQTNH